MEETADDKAAKRNKTGRSPAYPFISVAKALDQTRALHKQEGEYAAPLTSAFDAWGYGSKSSGGRQTLAALKYYGLIDISGEGDARKVKISDLARRILLDTREDETEKKALISKVAMSPAAHQAIYEEYPRGLASDGSVIHFLTFGLGFKGEAPKELLSEFKETAAYIGLYQPGSVLDKASGLAPGDGGEKPKREVEIGDLVNVERGGTLVFPEAVKVTAIEEKDGQVWVWTDGSEAWTEMESVIPEPKGSAPPTLPPPPPAPAITAAVAAAAARALVAPSPTPGTQEDKFSLEEGVVTIRFPDNMSEASVIDLEDFFALFIKKAKRRAGVQ